jgi:hypothetical protein
VNWSRWAPRPALTAALLSVVIVALVACNDDSIPNAAANAAIAPQFTVGGTVSGLTSGAGVALINGSDTATVSTDGAFTFSSPVSANGSYSVTVATQPTGETCTVSNGRWRRNHS